VIIEQCRWTEDAGWEPSTPHELKETANLVLLFGSTNILKHQLQLAFLQQMYPHALFLGCSTAGEICGTQVTDESLVATAIHFEHTTVRGTHVHMKDVTSSYEAGKHLAHSLETKDLAHVFVLSDGQVVNGSELVKGLTENLPNDITVTGGISGDGERFKETLVLLHDIPKPEVVAILGFYGSRLKVGYGSLGGWDPFGPERLVTKSRENMLYELDGKSALELYKKYLGDHAAGLPATALLFPLSLRSKANETGVVRTILGIDENQRSMTFAGDIPEGSYVRFMKANFDRLIDGAAGAAKTTYNAVSGQTADLAVLISCVGRKMVLKQRVEEEVEGVRDVLGPETVLTGFYSYGEISPFTPNAKCELHNQTMTITTFSES